MLSCDNYMIELEISVPKEETPPRCFTSVQARARVCPQGVVRSCLKLPSYSVRQAANPVDEQSRTPLLRTETLDRHYACGCATSGGGTRRDATRRPRREPPCPSCRCSASGLGQRRPARLRLDARLRRRATLRYAMGELASSCLGLTAVRDCATRLRLPVADRRPDRGPWAGH